ncbi:MAG: Unknown protein [uncultured Campylobacterales bacterium]|uniref:Type IV pilus assembly protein PilO n=1 Tax=uncultured Campylobacterales bacterium TaxID=352960 RepID=A0A6S6T3K2_9BACT|nr:MAG: Unknown protein [uncultured Campylobacterales bacterium]
MNKFFDKIDSFMGQRKSSEKFIILFAVFGLILYIFWTNVFPITEQKLKKAKTELSKSERKLKVQQDYLNSRLRGNNEELEKRRLEEEVSKMKLEYETIVIEDALIDDKMKKLSKKLSRDNLWTLLLDEYSNLAKKYNVKVNHIENEILKVKLKSFEEYIKFNINVTGTFKNIVKFLSDIERSATFVELKNLKLETSKNLNLDFDIAVRELKY